VAFPYQGERARGGIQVVDIEIRLHVAFGVAHREIERDRARLARGDAVEDPARPGDQRRAVADRPAGDCHPFRIDHQGLHAAALARIELHRAPAAEDQEVVLLLGMHVPGLRHAGDRARRVGAALVDHPVDAVDGGEEFHGHEVEGDALGLAEEREGDDAVEPGHIHDNDVFHATSPGAQRTENH